MPTQNDAKPSPVPTPKEEVVPEPEPVVDEIETTPESVNTDVSSLFDDVWTQSADTKVDKKEEKVDYMSLAGSATRSESIPIARKIHKKAKRQTQSNEFALFEKRNHMNFKALLSFK